MGDGNDLLTHRVEVLEERVTTHGREIDKMQDCITRLTVLEERSDKRSGLFAGAVATVAAGVALALLLAWLGLK